MTVSRERLHQAACRAHAAAENNHRIHGYAAALLVAVADTGPETLILLPQGLPPQQVLRAIARQTRAIALVVTSEAWVSIPGLSARTVAELPREDLPVPAEDPNRLEAIVTTAVGFGPTRAPLTLIRASHIRRHSLGTTLGAARDEFPGVHVDHVETRLATALAQA